MSMIKRKLIELIERLEAENDFEDEFYKTYTGQLNDGDISEWHNNHFDDNVELGVSTGEKLATEQLIGELKKIVKGEE